MTSVERQCTILETVQRWTPLMRTLSQRFRNRLADTDDLFSEGVCAIIRAVDAFDETRGVALDTVVYRCIYNGIISAAQHTDFAVSIPSGSSRFVRDSYDHSEIQAFKGVSLDAIDETLAQSTDFVEPSIEGYIDLVDLIDRLDNTGICHMYWVEGKKYEEISLIKGTSIATISRIVTRVRDAVRSHLGYLPRPTYQTF